MSSGKDIKMSDTVKNKVYYGFSELYVGTYTDNNGTVTLGTPYKVPGAVKMTLEPSSDLVQFAADNDPNYYSNYSSNGFSGEFEQALFDDEFKTKFLGYVALDGGGVAQVANPKKPKVYFMGQIDGDALNRRFICYNTALGEINREASTTEGTNEPSTAKLPFTVSKDEGTGITKAEYNETDSVYSTMFTTPPVPTLPSQSE